MSDRHKTPLLVSTGVAVLLVAGSTAAYWFGFHRNRSPADLPVGVSIVPQDALMTVSISTNEGQWHKLRQFGTPETQRSFDRFLVDLRDNLLTANGYDYQEDIQPWIGQEVTLAFLSPSSAIATDKSTPSLPPVASESSVLMVVPVANPLRAKQVLEKKQSQVNSVSSNRTYKGVQIREIKGNSSNSYSTAVLGGRYLVVTSNFQATNRAIDTYKGNPSVASTPGYKQALNNIQNPSPFARIYINVPEAAAVASANSARPVPLEELATLRDHQGLAATAILKSEGIEFQGISWLNPQSEKQHLVENSATSMPKLLPAETLVMISGGNLDRLWQDYALGANANPVAAINPQWLQEALAETTGLDLEADLFDWMEGEFSISIIPAVEGTNTVVPFGLLLMVEASDRRAAETALERLDRVMQEKYAFQVEEATLENRPVINWTPTFGLVNITRGWLDGNVTFLAVGAPIAEAIVPQPNASLATSQFYQKFVPQGLNPNNGHFLMDVDRIFNGNILDGLFQLPSEVDEHLSAIRSIGVTAAVTSPRTTRYDVFVGLRKGDKPSPLPNPKTDLDAAPSSEE